MNVNDIYGSRFMRAADLKGKRKNFVIESAEVELLGQKNERRLVLGLKGSDKGLVLNKTNSMVLASLYGENSEDWIGSEVELRTERVVFQNQMVDSIRLGAPPEPRF